MICEPGFDDVAKVVVTRISMAYIAIPSKT